MTYDQWKDPTDYSPDPPICEDCASRAQDIYICATERARGLESEIERLKSLIAGARIRVVSPDEDGYCGDGINPGLEIQWPDRG